ncbi:sterol desaturase/sphingolipid hydroxylase (fatty acid hydroxylase superfamily) [Bradyrhizobium sp. GM24.11]
MITPHPRLQVNVAEQLARSIVPAAHAPSPNLVGANESWSPVDDECLFQQPAREAGVIAKGRFVGWSESIGSGNLAFFEVADMDPLGLKIILISCLVFVPLERLFALHPQQKVFRRAWANDLIFLLVNGLLIKLGLLAFIAGSTFLAASIVPASVQSTVGGLPYWVQIPLVIMLSDLGFYWTHRMFHAVPWLWRFHAIHHSIEELDWLAATRIHPIDQILTKGASLVPVVALGFSEWTIVVYALLFQWQSVFIHANVRFRFGPLRFLFASPEFHRWHHASDRDARDRNFAAQLSFLDALFGTLHMPKGQMPTAYGLDRPMPQRYALQLLNPFVSDRVRRSIPALAAMDGEPQPTNPAIERASTVHSPSPDS